MDEAQIKHNFTNHPPESDDVAADFDQVTSMFTQIGLNLNAMVPDSREKSLMMTNLEQASMWAKAGIARNQ